MLPYSVERRIAIKAVEQASLLCQKVFKNIVKESHILKSDASPVTIADFGSQAVLNSILADHFPTDPIVGEEDANELRQNSDLAHRVLDLVNSVPETNMTLDQMLDSVDRGNYDGGRTGRFWTLDPIDGTKGFLRGDQYAICLALIENGQVQVGVLGCPNLARSLQQPQKDIGCIYAAVRGQGAFEILTTGERQIHVSAVSSPSQSTFCESFESSHSSQDDTARISKHMGIQNDPLRMDSQCKYAIVARGDADIYMRFPDYDQNIWDHAAGALIVEEAGGQITDTLGKSLDFGAGAKLFNNKGIVATNGKIHSSVLKAIQETQVSKI